MIEIKLFSEKKLTGYTLLEGFPGAGLVGSMATSYIIGKLDMEYIGYVSSNMFPPIAAIHANKPMFPVRIYANTKHKIVVVISEFTIPQDIIYQLSEELLHFAKKYGISRIISIGGIPVQVPKDTAYFIASNPTLSKKTTQMGLNPIGEGVIAGVTALLLTNCEQYKIPALALLVEVMPAIMDPKYAEIAIKSLQKIIDLHINTSDLEKESKIVEAKVRDVLKKAKDTHDSYKKAVEATGPSMYV